MGAKWINREVSWLGFNARVLQEAQDKTVPLWERIKFLGIFSNNLDEFFRVRVATLQRSEKLHGKKNPTVKNPFTNVLDTVLFIVKKQQTLFENIYNREIIPELKKNKIELINDKKVNAIEKKELQDYFWQILAPRLFPIIMNKNKPIPELLDGSIYLAIRMTNKSHDKEQFAILSIPTSIVSRFYIIKSTIHLSHKKIILIDDIIRLCLPILFSSLHYSEFSAYTFKITRDSELDFEENGARSLIDMVQKSVGKRKMAELTRFIYDKTMHPNLLLMLIKKLKVKNEMVIPGGKYHNFKDFMDFPQIPDVLIGGKKFVPKRNVLLDKEKNLLNYIQKQDLLLCYPYQTFDYIVRILREAAIDPHTEKIYISLYRIANNSSIANALINACKNGKFVVAVVELQARFMEEHNILWANKLRNEGVTVLHGNPRQKIHSKLFYIERNFGNKKQIISHIGTGNFNEQTATLYSDFSLITSNKKIGAEVYQVFNIIQNKNLLLGIFDTLWVSPFSTFEKLEENIYKEIANAKAGKAAKIIIKCNNLEHVKTMELLLLAAGKGVKIDLIVRSICCIPNQLHKNIHVISLVDKFLEHARIFYFHNNNKPNVFIGSADLMERNIDFRIEVTTPIIDKHWKNVIIDFLELQLKDNVKARLIDDANNNTYKTISGRKIRSQLSAEKLF